MVPRDAVWVCLPVAFQEKKVYQNSLSDLGNQISSSVEGTLHDMNWSFDSECSQRQKS